ncbi:hypothetical protein H112_00440 [Trichophyton rubrum D6]|uniref:Enoyl reductase (ER) domain-containing protein n=2 Tax=Trichophyton rubrum TaxID=5551 RepID=F2SZR6_TRIRC|nr:uncharacterized protein TERG_08055 [Trichophyton rubrum CBS 118892]EZF27598.1 hypothetical protein H100_00439 [Trichophyton rubrum MR850]EZF46633.1 hypothetical protein H102_00439 [Trichophyton rubrum CBS 100081]EZF57296.1 hypothetical protein H103_00439 [Trichophyton rubrum CBS 288.86]EZF67893.1 hypothetical protein H104_00429 [Trichophyton rubrum CBS 289.86]EZF89148.1 hypothetical protein H110_00443 [Trichophyton rubrum MR1448]EZG00005.1 hypothetical protein H113_00443 [Trichophyton rubr
MTLTSKRVSNAQLKLDIKNGSGAAADLFINDSVPKPVPSPTQCLVRVKAFGINRADTIQRSGFYPPPPGASKILGLEFSGVIEAVGSDQASTGTQWKVGDEVFGLVYGGAYAEYVEAEMKLLIAKPADWSWEYAAGVCEIWFTALQALYVVGGYDADTTRSILWHAGASSVSIAGIQLSRLANSLRSDIPAPKVFATARSDEKSNFCVQELSCVGAVNTSTHGKDWDEEIKKMNGGQGIDLIIDYVGPTYFQQNLNVAARDGRIVLLGLLAGSILPDGVDIRPVLMKRLKFEGSTLRSRDVNYQARVRELFEEKVFRGLKTGLFKHVVDSVFKWEDIQKAHELVESNKTKGKVICTIDW